MCGSPTIKYHFEEYQSILDTSLTLIPIDLCIKKPKMAAAQLHSVPFYLQDNPRSSR